MFFFHYPLTRARAHMCIHPYHTHQHTHTHLHSHHTRTHTNTHTHTHTHIHIMCTYVHTYTQNSEGSMVLELQQPSQHHPCKKVSLFKPLVLRTVVACVDMAAVTTCHGVCLSPPRMWVLSVCMIKPNANVVTVLGITTSRMSSS